MQQLSNSKYFFPPPLPSTNHKVYGVIVEKKEERLYCISPEMIKSCMMIPKKDSNNLKVGDWIECEVAYLRDGNGREYMEREIIKVMKVEEKDHSTLNIPSTRVSFGKVQFKTRFVICPHFIRHSSISNSTTRSYQKLIILNMGQGYYALNNRNMPREFHRDQVYMGVFEYTYGVMFSTNGEKDANGVDLETVAPWELVWMVEKRVTTGEEVTHIPIENDESMKNYLIEIKQRAKYWEKKRAAGTTNQMSTIDDRREMAKMEGPVFPFNPAVDDFQMILQLDNNANPYVKQQTRTTNQQ